MFKAQLRQNQLLFFKNSEKIKINKKKEKEEENQKFDPSNSRSALQNHPRSSNSHRLLRPSPILIQSRSPPENLQFVDTRIAAFGGVCSRRAGFRRRWGSGDFGGGGGERSMWEKLANFKENLSQIALDVHDAAEELDGYGSQAAGGEDGSASDDRRYSHRFAQSKSPLRASTPSRNGSPLLPDVRTVALLCF